MRRGVVVALAAVVLAFPAIGANASIPPTRTRVTTLPVHAVPSKLVVDDDVGQITVTSGSSTIVRRTEHWFLVEPKIEQTYSNGVLKVKSRCNNNILVNECSVDLAITVPSATSVQAGTAVGDVHVTNMAGPITVSSATGDVVLDTRSVPHSVALRTANGDAIATLPRGPYALKLSATNGRVRTSGVSNVATSAHKIIAETSNGDVTVTGR